MPGKDAANPRRRKDSVDKKRLKGLQIFKRSKSKQSLQSTPSVSAASGASVDGSVAGDEQLSFDPADDAPSVSEPPSQRTSVALSPGEPQRRSSAATPISLSRIFGGEVTESDSAAAGSVGGGGEADVVETPCTTSPATPRSNDDTQSFDGINGELAQKLQTVEELERKIAKMKADLDQAAEKKRRQDEMDSKIIEALIMQKMHGLGLLSKPQMTEASAEPQISLPDSPLANGPAGHNSKMGPLAKLDSATSVVDATTTNAQITSNTSTRIAKRSQELQANAAVSSSSAIKANFGSLSTTATSQAQNFNRKVSQTQLSGSSGNGLAAEDARLPAAAKLSTAAANSVQAASVNAVKALHGMPSIASANDVRQLKESFNKLKGLRPMNGPADSLSMENLADGDLLTMDLGGSSADQSGGSQANVNVFEQKQSFSSSNKTMVTNDFSAEESTANSAQTTRLQQGDNLYSQNEASSDMRARLQMNGVTAEKGLSTRQEEEHVRAGDFKHDESRSAAVAGAKLSTAGFSTQRVAMAEDEQRQTVASGVVNTEQRSSASTHSKVTISKQQGHVTTPTSSSAALAVESLDRLERSNKPEDFDRARDHCSQQVRHLLSGLDQCAQEQQASAIDQMDMMMQRAWRVPSYGRELGTTLSEVIKSDGGLDVLMRTCNTGSKEMDLRSARVLGQCLTSTNRAYVVERGLDNVVQSACRTCADEANEQESRVGSGILESLFKHSEDTCSDVVRMGGLDAVITQCRKKDVETLRHCASALANLSLYGGSETQQAMTKRKVPTWLFPLAFHTDDNIKYYACLAIATMVANQEIEAAVLKSGTLDLVHPFVTSHDPAQFSKQTLTHLTSHSDNWLRRLVRVLSSKREEAVKLAAFHFCMEAGVKIREGYPEVFQKIGAIEPLKKVASSPNAVASKYAAQALRLLGQEVPYELSQQVPLWSVRDVREWLKQIDFPEYADAFEISRVDGDLLLRMTEDMLKDDIGISNGILRTRFVRELNNLKKMVNYSSCDSTGLNTFLQSISPELSVYTYQMLKSGVDKDYLRYLTDEQLLRDCYIYNSIHRLRIQQAVTQEVAPPEPPDGVSKTLDCFISYRRSNGSQLASLLRVHLSLRNFTVFLDVERLEAGKFHNNLLNSVRQAQNFILVLTPAALDRCIDDVDQKDWIHKEVVTALQAKCKIIPIMDNFSWPETEKLPEDMRPISTFNGITWVHDYQDACVDKLERFIRGDVERPDVRYSPALRTHPSQMRLPGSRGQSPGRLTPVASPLPRRPRRYQTRLASPATMPRSRSMDALLASGQRPVRGSPRDERPDDDGRTAPEEGGSEAETSTDMSQHHAPEQEPPRQHAAEQQESERQVTEKPGNGELTDQKLDQERAAAPDGQLSNDGTDGKRQAKPSLLPQRAAVSAPPRRPPPPALLLSVPSQEQANPPTPSPSRTKPSSGADSPVGRRIRRRSEQTPTTPPAPECETSIGARQSRRSDLSRQNRLRKSNVVERALTKVRSAIAKENK